MININQVAGFKSCLTCAYRKFYPPSTKNGKMVFSRFLCSGAAFSSRELVRPEDICDFWQRVTLESETTESV